MHKTDVAGLAAFSDSGPAKNVFYDAGALKAQLNCLKSGQRIPPCEMSNDVLFFIISGEGIIIVDDKAENLAPLTSVVVPKEAESRSIEAKTDMVFLAVQGINGR